MLSIYFLNFAVILPYCILYLVVDKTKCVNASIINLYSLIMYVFFITVFWIVKVIKHSATLLTAAMGLRLELKTIMMLGVLPLSVDLVTTVGVDRLELNTMV